MPSIELSAVRSLDQEGSDLISEKAKQLENIKIFKSWHLEKMKVNDMRLEGWRCEQS
jgi:hypothetical protein